MFHSLSPPGDWEHDVQAMLMEKSRKWFLFHITMPKPAHLSIQDEALAGESSVNGQIASLVNDKRPCLPTFSPIKCTTDYICLGYTFPVGNA